MKLEKYIDHTLLKPDATNADILKLCQEGIKHDFFGICVHSRFIPLCRKALIGSSVQLVSVVGFPLGAMTMRAKAYETDAAVNDGADEVDMVIPIGALKEGDYNYLLEDIKSVVKAAASKPVKVIIETVFLTEAEKSLACRAILDGGAHFVKTCTGFAGGSATVADIQLIKSLVGSHIGIKASGGIKTKQFAMDLIAAGATRLGTSSGVSLLKETIEGPKNGDAY